MASNASQLFDRIVGEPTRSQQVVEQMIADKEPESGFLEYKKGEFDTKAMRGKWCEALSAFANTDGGVMLWGVDCRPEEVPGTKYRLDRPTGVPALAKDAVRLGEQLKDWVATATTDVVERVKIVAVPFSGGPAGCFVCYVPQGQNQPYRATSDSLYYMRQPDRMAVVPHGLLRNMFFPRYTPSIEIDVVGQAFISNTAESYFTFVVDVSNSGVASAHEVLIRVECEHEFAPTNQPGAAWELSFYRYGAFTSYKGYQYAGVRPLHPSSQQGLCTLKSSAQSMLALFNGGRVTLVFKVFARDTPPRSLHAVFVPHYMMTPKHVQATLVEAAADAAGSE